MNSLNIHGERAQRAPSNVHNENYKSQGEIAISSPNSWIKNVKTKQMAL